MKRPIEEFLDELFEETAPANFRTSVLNQALRQARVRKRVRRIGAGAAVAAVAVIAVAVAMLDFRKPGPARDAARSPDLVIVESKPLDPSQVVGTGMGPTEVATSSGVALNLVETRVDERVYAELDDQELLALFAGKPVALVKRGPNRAELIFLNPGDDRGIVER